MSENLGPWLKAPPAGRKEGQYFPTGSDSCRKYGFALGRLVFPFPAFPALRGLHRLQNSVCKLRQERKFFPFSSGSGFGGFSGVTFSKTERTPPLGEPEGGRRLWHPRKTFAGLAGRSKGSFDVRGGTARSGLHRFFCYAVRRRVLLVFFCLCRTSCMIF